MTLFPDKYLYDTISDKLREYRLSFADIPEYITSNLRFTLFKWQRDALLNFLDMQNIKRIESPCTASHYMFNMATGTGKTLVLAAMILYYYKQGYRNFIFFVDQNNIVGKTEDNLTDASHHKYLFANPIVIDDKTIDVKKVDNFSPYVDGTTLDNPTIDYIEIIFTSIHKLHNAMYVVRENDIFLDDLQKRDLVLLADEAHSFNADTKKRKNTQADIVEFKELREGAKAEDVERSWENTVTSKLLNKEGIKAYTNNNVLLEFTATIPKDIQVSDKYKNKIIIKFDLPEFLKAGYTKEINLVSSNFDKKQRILQALLFNWYRNHLALEYGLKNFKPVILFRSKFSDIKLDGNVQEDYLYFREIVDNISDSDFLFLKAVQVEQAQKLYEIGQSRIVDIVRIVNNKYLGSFQIIINYIKTTFKENNCIVTHSNDKTATGRKGEEKTTYDQDRLLNSLEDKKNPITAIFTCKRLTQGWDVLNLYDIVRMYEGQNTGGSNKGNIGASTVSEVQLIGRGVRYNPFFYNDLEVNKRKFDKELNHPLRVLEEFYFHSDKDERYINELKSELKNQKLFIDDKKVIKHFDIKEEIKNDKNSFYHTLQIFANEKVENPNRRKSTLDDVYKDFHFQYTIPAYDYTAQKVIFDEGKNDEIRHQQGNEDKKPVKKKFSEFVNDDLKHIILKAYNQVAKKENSLLRFDKLKQELQISSIDDLWNDTFLGKFYITLYLPNTYESLFDVDPKILVKAFLRFFEQFIIEWKKEIHPFNGSEFKPRPFKYYFEKTKAVAVIEDDRNRMYENTLLTKDWYALNHFQGTSEEQALIQFIIDTVEKFKEKYENVYLVRNEEVYKIYDFKDGNGFMPDFLLFLKQKSENLYYQVFIEPKGSQFKDSSGSFDQSKEGWKECFLKEITDKYGKANVLQIENRDYRLVGLPLFNATMVNEFNKSINDNLEVSL
ncbi:DEAD/DEAH box helicase family protein [Sphingobacterium kitahiroshimense]|uniref:DEAD/DEAH box helicase family protein n=1 Tax=Sphingobacterium sp. B16(2022) TaxID=2914044 RepID=UPI0014389D21|nr:DEAD/DEAH box helicase family protein [Sphingobacterium sp. B16(2022)]NJI71948.1 DEAD/DEAH box helicase family protein [Sphingobacterium sp. B16(2022)]